MNQRHSGDAVKKVLDIDALRAARVALPAARAAPALLLLRACGRRELEGLGGAAGGPARPAPPLHRSVRAGHLRGGPPHGVHPTPPEGPRAWAARAAVPRARP